MIWVKARRCAARKNRIAFETVTHAATDAIIDAHHHIWRLSHTPWLNGPMVPRIFGDYEPLRRDYPVEEYLAEAAAAGVVKSVYVQVNVAPGAEVE